jgi:cell division cycle 14
VLQELSPEHDSFHKNYDLKSKLLITNIRAMSLLWKVDLIPNVYLKHGRAVADHNDFILFEPNDLEYIGFCDDFGPMSASTILDFVSRLRLQMQEHPGINIAYRVKQDRRHTTNAVFLLGSYAILVSDISPDQVWESFSHIPQNFFEHYRDATHSATTFDLTILDCWRALARGKSLGWINQPSLATGLCGGMDKDEYDHYDDPNNGDLHIVVPGEFVAFRGPVDMPHGVEYRDTDGFRDFAPSYYLDCFHALGVKTVVRLNERHYDSNIFEANGIHHVDLFFHDCTPPSDAIVSSFLQTVDAAPGLIAVHCRAGLGRTGTLIALSMMRRHRFTAREAIAWLRIMRPGSVLGEQQGFLCAFEARVAAAAARRRRHSVSGACPPPASSLPPAALVHGGRCRAADPEGSAAQGRAVAAAMRRRCAARGKALAVHVAAGCSSVPAVAAAGDGGWEWAAAEDSDGGPAREDLSLLRIA